MKRTFLFLLAVVVVLASVSIIISQKRANRLAEQMAFEKAKAERAAELERLRYEERRRLAPVTLPPPESSPQEKAALSGQSKTIPTNATSQPGNTDLSSATSQSPAAPPQISAGPKPGKVWQDPLARLALSFVGDDDVAEAYWVEAINNPDLPPNERKDLIEDLNEDGFPDPKNVSAQDLPLILSRLALIEEHAPDSMDAVNAAAFMEAYKDLVNMAARAMQGIR